MVLTQMARTTGAVVAGAPGHRGWLQRTIDRLHHLIALVLVQKTRQLIDLRQRRIQTPGPGLVIRAREGCLKPPKPVHRLNQWFGISKLHSRRIDCCSLIKNSFDCTAIKTLGNRPLNQTIASTTSVAIVEQPLLPSLRNGCRLGHQPFSFWLRI